MSGTRIHIPQRCHKDREILDCLAARKERVLGVLRQHLLLEELGGDDSCHAKPMSTQQKIITHLEFRRDVMSLRDSQHVPKHGARRPDQFFRGSACFADEDALEKDLVCLRAYPQRNACQEFEGAETGHVQGFGAVAGSNKGW